MPAASAASFRGGQAARRPRAAPSAANPVTARRRAASQPGRVRLPSGAKGSVVTVSVILPAKNEAEGLRRTLPALRERMPAAEIIVVDDGSTDDTAEVAAALGARVLGSPYSMGNGAAIKRGARAATGEILVFMDADGQHDPACIQTLLAKLDEGYDMVVGARDWSGQAGVHRGVANAFYNWLASRMTGFEVKDLTSGFRAVRAAKFLEFLHLLPNGFSYPTTSTMAFFRSAYPVAYVPIPVARRVGTNSHIRPLKDGIRFLLIIFKIATLYSPLKLFAPAAMCFFLAGAGYYAYTYATYGRFTNMSMLLLSASVIIFLIGLVSEQITTLTYKADSQGRA
jgi:glycosyltransferase involved in cell wall biosynthesis